MENVIKFKNLEFTIYEEGIYLTRFGKITAGNDKDRMFLYSFAEAQVAGEMKETHMGIKLASSSEIRSMKYVYHQIEGNVLTATPHGGFGCPTGVGGGDAPQPLITVTRIVPDSHEQK